MFGIAAVVLFIIAAILAWSGLGHAEAIAYAGLACLAIHVVFPWSPWTGRRPVLCRTLPASMPRLPPRS